MQDLQTKSKLMTLNEVSQFYNFPLNTLRRWCAERRFPIFKVSNRVRVSVEEFDVVFDTQDDKDLALLVVKQMLINHSWYVMFSFHYALDTCETPIEKGMFSALALLGKQNYNTVQYVYESPAGFKNDPASKTLGGDYVESPYTLIIEPQAKMGKYRVDFLITHKLDSYFSTWKD